MKLALTKAEERYYPLCSKYKLLRRMPQGGLVVSSAALHDLLEPAAYQRACQVYQYAARVGPMPASIEEFLKRNPPQRRKRC